VFKLLKLVIGLAGLGAFVWWGATVKLGDRTLFGQIAAIGHSKESKDRVRGTKEKVSDLRKRIGGDAEKLDVTGEKNPAERSPQEHLTNADRKEMRRLIDSARAKVSKGTPN